MIKTIQTLAAVLVAMTVSVQAQTAAKELVKNNPITQLERGMSIDVYGDYTIVGSTMGVNATPGAGMLFYQNQFIRDYKTNVPSDGIGEEKTVSIDQHAIALTTPKYNEGGADKGKLLIYNKTWNGTHYSPTVSQSFVEGTTGTGFGRAVSISDDWIAVGAPDRNTDGGVKLYYRNSGTGLWEDKGWLATPNFNIATYRYSYGIATQAKFGSSVSINRENLIVGATNIGACYIYKLNRSNNTWQYSAEYSGTEQVGSFVAISDEYAASAAGNKIVIMKKSGNVSNPWPVLQTIVYNHGVSSIAADGSRLIVGNASGGTNNLGEVLYYEIRGHFIPGTWTWINDFVYVGKMFVNPAASTHGMIEYRLLGRSVGIHGNTVVAGAPNTRYTPITFADGAGFRATFDQRIQARVGDADENDAMGNAISPSFYPNPASDVVNVATDGDIMSATATTSTGVKIALQTAGNQAITSGLAPGVYTITVVTKDGEISQNVAIK